LATAVGAVEKAGQQPFATRAAKRIIPYFFSFIKLLQQDLVVAAILATKVAGSARL
jgi:hypothetical protein